MSHTSYACYPSSAVIQQNLIKIFSNLLSYVHYGYEDMSFTTLPIKHCSLQPLPSILFSTRSVSSKYIKPHPRSYRRRLYEAAVAPILPTEISSKQCTVSEVLERLNRQKTDFGDIELAEVKEIKRWIREHEFRVMVVCQFLSVAGRTLWLTRNQLRLSGLELREIDNKIATKLFENTAFDSLKSLWCGQNVFLFGKDITVFKAIVQQTKKTNFLIPLVLTFDDRIIPMKEIEKLAELSDLEIVRAQTAAILDQIPLQLSQALGHHGQQLSTILGQISSTSNDATAETS